MSAQKTPDVSKGKNSRGAFGVSKDKMEMTRRVLMESPCNFVVEFS
jgi:hypothetical protein